MCTVRDIPKSNWGRPEKMKNYVKTRCVGNIIALSDFDSSTRLPHLHPYLPGLYQKGANKRQTTKMSKVRIGIVAMKRSSDAMVA